MKRKLVIIIDLPGEDEMEMAEIDALASVMSDRLRAEVPSEFAVNVRVIELQNSEDFRVVRVAL